MSLARLALASWEGGLAGSIASGASLVPSLTTSMPCTWVAGAVECTARAGQQMIHLGGGGRQPSNSGCSVCSMLRHACNPLELESVPLQGGAV